MSDEAIYMMFFMVLLTVFVVVIVSHHIQCQKKHESDQDDLKYLRKKFDETVDDLLRGEK